MEYIMDVARIVKRITKFENILCEIKIKQGELEVLQKKNHEKIMEGFRLIVKAFHLNCSAQMTMAEQIDEATGIITDFSPDNF